MKFIFALLLFFSLISYSNAQIWQNLMLDETAEGLDENPIRGLIPGFPGVRNFPYSMEFTYLPLRNTMLGIDSVDWTELENKLEVIADEGNTAVLRFYLDYPNQPVGTPQFLIDAGITMNAYTHYGNDPLAGESLSPDYNDPLMMEALLNFIENFGAQYNGDPRISVVQGGLIGFWGEWHTFPELTLNMSDSNKAIIFQAFIDAFPETHVNIREPQNTVSTTTEMQVGYHDDSFMQSTIGPQGWHFWPKMINAGLREVWKFHPLGGEIYPSLQQSVWDSIPNPVGQDFNMCMDSTHATYMLNHGIFDDSVGSISYLNALEQNRKFGYTFHVNAVKINAFEDGNIDIDVRIENMGIAPFYYNWDVEFALFQNGTLASLGVTDWNIPSILPDTIIEKNFNANHPLDTGEYTILMRFVNPLTSLKPNAKQLHFANSEQNADLEGWISLVTAEYSTLGINDENITNSVLVYPNPSRSSCSVQFYSHSEYVKIELTDLQNRLIQCVFYEFLTLGDHQIEFSLEDISVGNYLLHISKPSGNILTRIIKVD